MRFLALDHGTKRIGVAASDSASMVRSVNPPGETPGFGIPLAVASSLTVCEQREWLDTFLRARPVSRRSAMRGAVAKVPHLLKIIE